MLPIEKTKPTINLSKQVILIHGKPKIGKSTLVSRLFPNGLFIATEPGLNFLSVYKVNVNSWTKFIEVCGDIAKEPNRFSPIIIDTIDLLVTYCTEFICEREKINHPSDYEYGKGWGMVSKELQRVLTKLSTLGGLVLIGHTKTEEVKTKTKAYHKDNLTITGENRRIILSLADLILYIDHEAEEGGKEKRIIRTKSSLYWEAGSRSDSLVVLPETIPLDSNELAKYFVEKKEEVKPEQKG
jgi:hypothetical protein